MEINWEKDSERAEIVAQKIIKEMNRSGLDKSIAFLAIYFIFTAMISLVSDEVYKSIMGRLDATRKEVKIGLATQD